MTQPTIKQFSNKVKVEIYERLQSDYEGEMTEYEFNDLVCDIMSGEIDDAMNTLTKDGMDRLLCEFGIADAINLFHAECGEWADVNEKMLLYTVINHDLLYSLSHSDYLTWL
jgi:hypothetical protein